MDTVRQVERNGERRAIRPHSGIEGRYVYDGGEDDGRPVPMILVEVAKRRTDPGPVVYPRAEAARWADEVIESEIAAGYRWDEGYDPSRNSTDANPDH